MNFKTRHTLYLFIVFVSCAGNNNKIQTDEFQSANSESSNKNSTTNRLFTDIPYADSILLEEFQKDFLDNLVKNGDAEFESDSAYVIDNVRNYNLEDGYTVFYIHGRFLPSIVDFHFYGGYKGDKVQYDIYHLPVVTDLTLTRYELTPEYLNVYGILKDENSSDTEEVLLFVLQQAKP